jgi:hypothetical protein
MNVRSGFKILIIVALILNIAASLILFGSLRKLGMGTNQTSLLLYFSLFGIIVFSFILFLVAWISRSGEDAKTGVTESETEIKEESVAQDKISSPEITISVEELKNKAAGIVPEGAFVPDKDYSVKNFADESFSRIAKAFPITEGIFYLRGKESDEFFPIGDYAYFSEKPPITFKTGETLPGQVAKNKRAMNLSEVPEGYVKVASGLGMGSPRHLYFLPLINNEEVIAVIELASFKEFDKDSETLFELAANELSKALVHVQTRNL